MNNTFTLPYPYGSTVYYPDDLGRAEAFEVTGYDLRPYGTYIRIESHEIKGYHASPRVESVYGTKEEAERSAHGK